jgi:hypothetical protein
MPGQSFPVIDWDGEEVAALRYDRSLEEVSDTG